MKNYTLALISLLAYTLLSAQTRKLQFHTDFGSFKVLLYDYTPAHRDLILQAIKSDVYKGALFNRVISNFVVQGGEHDLDIEKREAADPLQAKPRLSPEFDERAFHKLGALGAGRDNNPEKASFLNQLYFVVGKPVTAKELDLLEQKKGITYTEAQRQTYLKSGGQPRLDRDYTVFGEVYEGLDVLLKISQVKTDSADFPVVPVPFRMEEIKDEQNSGMTALNPKFENLNRALDQLVEDNSHPGMAVMVSQHGTPVYTFFKGTAALDSSTPINAETRFRMASVSKQVTARAVWQLLENGQLTEEATLGSYFADLPPELSTIRVGQLLQHSSGISDYENVISRTQTAQLTDADVLELMRQHGSLYFKPGSDFRYSNTGYCLLSLLVEKASGKPFDVFVKEQLFRPRQIEKACVAGPSSVIANRAFGYHPDSKSFTFADQSITSATQGDGGVYFSASDFLKWSTHLINNDLADPHYRNLFSHRGFPVSDSVRYQSGLFSLLDQKNNLHLFHSGESTGFRNIVYYDVQDKLVVSVFCNRDDLLVSHAFDQVMDAFGKKKLFDSTLGQSLFLWLNKVYQGE